MLFDVISTKDIPKPILYKNRLPKWQTDFSLVYVYTNYESVVGKQLMARLHDIGEDTCCGYTRTRTIAANHHWIIVVAFGGDKYDIV